LSGYAAGGTAPTVGTIPAGYRPPSTVVFTTVANAGGTITIRDATVGSDGTLALAGGTQASSWVGMTAVWIAA
jgi:hypothetical protein